MAFTEAGALVRIDPRPHAAVVVASSGLGIMARLAVARHREFGHVAHQQERQLLARAPDDLGSTLTITASPGANILGSRIRLGA